MANVTVSTRTLEALCNWNIEEQDKGHDLEIHWGFQGRVKVMRPDVDGGDWLDYDIDREKWLNEDLPAIQEANEAENENYSI